MTAKNLPLMTGPELASCLDRCEEIEAWIRAVRAEALDRQQRKADNRAPGWKIVEGRKGDRTADPRDMERRIRLALVVHPEDADKAVLPKELYTEPQLKSVVQIEKACKKLGGLGKVIWSAITGDPEKGIPSLITQAEGRPQLVRDFDARPELAPQPVVFELRPVGEEFARAPQGAEGLI